MYPVNEAEFHNLNPGVPHSSLEMVYSDSPKGDTGLVAWAFKGMLALSWCRWADL